MYGLSPPPPSPQRCQTRAGRQPRSSLDAPVPSPNLARAPCPPAATRTWSSAAQGGLQSWPWPTPFTPCREALLSLLSAAVAVVVVASTLDKGGHRRPPLPPPSLFATRCHPSPSFPPPLPFPNNNGMTATRITLFKQSLQVHLVISTLLPHPCHRPRAGCGGPGAAAATCHRGC